MAGRRPNQHVIMVLDAGHASQQPGLGATDPSSSGASSPFQLARSLLTQYALSDMQFGMKSSRLGVVVTGVTGGGATGLTVPHALEPPGLDVVRGLARLDPGPGVKDSGRSLAAGIRRAVELLEGQKRNKTNACKIVVFGCGGAAATPLDGASALGREAAADTSIEVITVGCAAGSAAAASLEALAAGAGAAAVPASEAWLQLSQVRVSKASPVPAFRGELDIAGIVRVPVHTYKLVDRARMPTLTKASTLAGADAGGKVEMDRSYRLVDPPHTEVPPEAQASVFPFGRDLFPASAMDVDGLKSDAAPCLSVIGFLPAASVQLCWLMGPAFAVAPAQASATGKYKDVPLTHGVSALARALADTERAGVARYVSKQGSSPQLVVLFPYLGTPGGDAVPSSSSSSASGGAGGASSGAGDADMLVLLRLPFSEDVRQFPFPALDVSSKHVRDASTAAHADAARALLDSLDAPAGDGGVASAPAGTAPAGTAGWAGPDFAAASAGPSLAPHAVPNPIIARVRDFVSARALDPDAPLPGARAAVARALYPDAAVLARAKTAGDRFTALFGLRVAPGRAAKRKRAFGFEAEEGPLLADGADLGDAAKRLRPAGGELPTLGAGPGTVGAVDPVGDFRRLLADETEDRGGAAVAGMMEQIKRMAGEEALHGRVLDCLRALRAGCVGIFEEARYNALLHGLKDAATGAPGAGSTGFKPGDVATSELWSKVREAGAPLGLITAAESRNSTVASELAVSFLADDAMPAPAAPPAPASEAGPEEEDDEDDLM